MSIRFYKNLLESEEDHKMIAFEIRKLQDTIDTQKENCDNNSISWSDLTSGAGRKSLIIGIVLVMLCVCNGVFAISIYSASIFQETGSNLSPNMSTIVLGIIQCVASCVTMHLVDRSGRKVIFRNSNPNDGIKTEFHERIFILDITRCVWSWKRTRSYCVRCIYDG